MAHYDSNLADHNMGLPDLLVLLSDVILFTPHRLPLCNMMFPTSLYSILVSNLVHEWHYHVDLNKIIPEYMQLFME